MAKYVACGYRIIVKPDKVEEVSKGGIVIPDAEGNRERAVQKGTVVSVGNLAWRAFLRDEKGQYVGPPWALEGTRIVFSQYAGRELPRTSNEEKLLILNDEEVLAIVVEEDTENE